MTKRSLIYLLGLALLVVAGLSFARRSSPPAFEMLEPDSGPASTLELPQLWQLPDFSLTERGGETVTLATLRGRIWIADFVYTTCPGPCPMLTSRFAQLQKELAAQTELRFVSISTDPEADTPEVLRMYAEQFHASDRWLFLTGPKQPVYALVNQGFKLSLAKDEDPAATDRVIHSTKFVLVDGDGVVRGVYEGLNEEGKAKLLRALRILQAEKK